MNQVVSVPYTATELLLIIGALSAAAVAVITAWRTKGAVTEIKTDVKTNTEELTKVHTLVNDRATKQDALNLELQSQIKVLIATIASQDKERALIRDRETQAASVQKGVAQGILTEQAKASLPASVASKSSPSIEVTGPEITGIIIKPDGDK